MRTNLVRAILLSLPLEGQQMVLEHLARTPELTEASVAPAEDLAAFRQGNLAPGGVMNTFVNARLGLFAHASRCEMPAARRLVRELEDWIVSLTARYEPTATPFAKSLISGINATTLPTAWANALT